MTEPTVTTKGSNSDSVKKLEKSNKLLMCRNWNSGIPLTFFLSELELWDDGIPIPSKLPESELRQPE